MPRCPLCDHSGPELARPCPDHLERRLIDERVLARYPEDTLLGTVINKNFVPVDIIGAGGMGRIYKALQMPLERPVAVKVLKVDHLDDENVRERFDREAQIMARFTHPNLVLCYDQGTIEGEETQDTSEVKETQVYIVMELLEGPTLKEHLETSRPFVDLKDMLLVARGIASGVAEAHAAGIIHRDLKPANIILKNEGLAPIPKVLDFGIARIDASKSHLTHTGMVFGTPAYMSPEQAMGTTDVGAYTDVYAFGVILYEMATGRRPFDSSQPLQLLFAHANKPVPPLSPRPVLAPLSEALRGLIMRCLAKTPPERPQNAGEVVRELDAILASLSPDGRESGAASMSLDAPTMPSLSLAPPARTSLSLAPPARSSLSLAPPSRSSLSGGDAATPDTAAPFAPATGMLAGIATAGFKASEARGEPEFDDEDPLMGGPTQAMAAIPVMMPPPVDEGAPTQVIPAVPVAPTFNDAVKAHTVADQVTLPSTTRADAQSSGSFSDLDPRARRQLLMIGVGVAVLLFVIVILTVLAM